MKKIISTLLLAFVFVSMLNAQTGTFYDFNVKDIDGNNFDLSALRGKKVLVVNLASKCGLTPQYEQLEELQKKYQHLNFTVIGFPCNDFRGQEPGTNAEIKEFCSATYGVTFPLMSKISVLGDEKSPIYTWLTSKDDNRVMDSEVKWNFQKYMIDENGNFVDVVYPQESPLCDKIIHWIEK